MVAHLMHARSAPAGLDWSDTAAQPRYSKTAQVMLFLLTHAVGGQNAVTGRHIRQTARMEADDVHRVLSAQAQEGRISKRKEVGAEARYWLDADQAAAADAYRQPLLAGRAVWRHDRVSAVDLAARLKFLIYCKERTQLGEFKVLDAIIADYRASLKAAAQAE